MLIVIQQVAILAIFALAGYALARAGRVKSGQTQILSTLLIYVCFPCTVFRTFSSQFTVAYLSEKYSFVLISSVLFAVVILVSKWAARRMTGKRYEQEVYGYTLIVPNTGYMGAPLVENLYGQAVLLNQMMFQLPLTLFTYTEGYRMLTGGEKFSFRRLMNPVTTAILLGCVVGISGLPVPSVLSVAAERASNCVGPLSMLLTGITISEFPFARLLQNKMAYLITLLRLVVIPFVLAGIASLFFSREIVLAVVMMYSMPCGLNTIVFPKLIGEDCEIGASLALLSNVLAILTIPLCTAVFLP